MSSITTDDRPLAGQPLEEAPRRPEDLLDRERSLDRPIAEASRVGDLRVPGERRELGERAVRRVVRLDPAASRAASTSGQNVMPSP